MTDSTLRWMCGLLPLLWVGCLVAPDSAAAQGSNYNAELEPHLVVQWDREPWCGDDGLGVGVRASFPVLKGGPLPNIDNSLALGVGLDYAHFDSDCLGVGRFRDEFDANSFWVPFDVQWNLFFTERLSALIELGLGLEHVSADCNDSFCDGYDDTDVHLVLWVGGRYLVTDGVAITLRLGTPSVLLGASFFL